MVAEIMTPKSSVKSGVLYNEKKVNAGQATFLFANNMMSDKEDVLEMDYAEKMRTFEYCNSVAQNPRMQKALFHVSINPSAEEIEQLDDEKYCKIAQEYMSRLGYGNQPYLVYRHNDIDREHIHIVSTRISSETGAKINDAFEKARSWRHINEIAKQYGFKSIIQESQDWKTRKKEQKEKRLKEFDALQDPDFDAIKATDSEKINRLKQLVNYVNSFNYRSESEFNSLLNSFGVKCEIIQDERHTGMRYSLKDSSCENKLSYPIKASAISKHYGLKHLQEKIQENSKLKPNKDQIKGIQKTIDWILNKKYNTITLDDFKKEMSNSGIKVFIYTNKENVLYGVHFFDLLNKNVYKGSELGLSANTLRSAVNEQSILKSDHKKINSVLITEYNKLKKRKAFYESDFVKDIDSNIIEFRDNIHKEMSEFYLKNKIDPQRETATINEYVNYFIEVKKNDLKQILDKENSYLYKNSIAFIRHAEKLPPEEQGGFIKLCGIDIKEKHGKKIMILSKFNREKIFYEYKGILDETSSIIDRRFFSKLEKEIIKKQPVIKDINFTYVDLKLNVFKYLGAQYTENLQKKMLHDVFFKACSQDKNETIKRLILSGVRLEKKGGCVFLTYKNTEIRSPLSLQEQASLNHLGGVENLSRSIDNFAIDRYVIGKDKISSRYDFITDLERAKLTKSQFLYFESLKKLYRTDRGTHDKLWKLIEKNKGEDYLKSIDTLQSFLFEERKRIKKYRSRL